MRKILALCLLIAFCTISESKVQRNQKVDKITKYHYEDAFARINQPLDLK